MVSISETFTMESRPAKKIFNDYQNMLNSFLKGLDKYSKTARRGFLLIVKDNTGLFRFGTKNLLLKFSKSKDCHSCQEEESWEEAARNDTKDL